MPPHTPSYPLVPPRTPSYPSYPLIPPHTPSYPLVPPHTPSYYILFCVLGVSSVEITLAMLGEEEQKYLCGLGGMWLAS